MHNLFLHAYGAVAQAIAQNTGVEIRTGASGYSTDGKVISMPTVDKNSIGPLIHEVAHIVVSDFTLKFGTPLEAHLDNLLEDIRIEQWIGNKYPGAKMYLSDMVEHLVKTGFFTAPSVGKDNHLMLQYIQYRLRADVLSQAGALEYSKAAEQLLQEKIPKGVLVKLNALMYRVEYATCELDCKNIALAIIAMMQEEAEKEEEERQQASQNQGQQEHAPEAKSGRGDDQQKGQNQQDAQQADKSAIDNQAKDGAGGTTGGQEKSFLRKVLESGGDDGLADVKDALKKACQQAVKEGRVDRVGLPFVTRAFSAKPTNSTMLTDVAAATNALRVQTRGLLQAETTSTKRNVMQGNRIDQRKLYRARTGGAIFQKVSAGKKLDTAITVLVDRSGSMSKNDRINLATKAALSASLAFSHPGVETAVLSFPYQDGNALLKGFADRATASVDKYEAIGVDGTTPMAEAIIGACMELANHRFDRKILLVATDGDPDNLQATMESITLARRAGIEVLGLGIQIDVTRVFGRKFSTQINDIHTLPAAMVNVLRDAVFN